MLVKIFACEHELKKKNLTKSEIQTVKNKRFTAFTTYIIPSNFPNLTVVILNNFLLHV